MSMSCMESQRWISMRVDGERIPFSVAGHFDEHLKACSACRDLLSLESRRTVIIRSALCPADAEGLKASILMGLEEGQTGGRPVASPFFISRTRFLQAAALLLVAAGGWLSLRFLASDGRDPGISRVIFEQDQVRGDVVLHDDGSPLRRETRHVRQVILGGNASRRGEGQRGGNGDGGAKAAPEPVRLHKARTDYIRLVDFPYW